MIILKVALTIIFASQILFCLFYRDRTLEQGWVERVFMNLMPMFLIDIILSAYGVAIYIIWTRL